MNITLILPFLLFFLSIVINILIINSKLYSNKKTNNVHKDILNRIYNTEKSIKEKLMISEEKFTEQKNNISTLAFEVDRKLKQLQSHGQELAKLSNTLNEYRSMLASLEIATNKTHEWVVSVRNDCENLENLKDLIKEHQNETYKIIDSYELAVEKQNSFYGDYEAKLEELRNGYVSEIDNYISIVEDTLNSKVVLLNQANSNLDTKIEESNNIALYLSDNEKKINEEFEKTAKAIKESNNNKINNFNDKVSMLSKSKYDDYKKDLDVLNNIEKEKYINNIIEFNSLKIEEVEDSINKVMDSLNYINKKEKNHDILENPLNSNIKEENQNSLKSRDNEDINNINKFKKQEDEEEIKLE